MRLFFKNSSEMLIVKYGSFCYFCTKRIGKAFFTPLFFTQKTSEIHTTNKLKKMKQTILILIFTLTTISYCNAQKIEMEKVFGGYKYSQNGNQMTMKDLVKTMEANQQAFDFIKKAQSNNTLASIFGGAGGFLVGWPIVTTIAEGDANWTLAGIGAGLIAIGIPFSTKANKNTKQAVQLYNSSLNATSFYEFKPVFKLIANGNGLGLSMNF